MPEPRRAQGYLGQVGAIRKDLTECFECQPKAAAKTYAVCTIRNTPDLPIHCVVWAKHMAHALFGPKDDGNPLADFQLNGMRCFAKRGCCAVTRFDSTCARFLFRL